MSKDLEEMIESFAEASQSKIPKDDETSLASFMFAFLSGVRVGMEASKEGGDVHVVMKRMKEMVEANE